MLYDVNLGIRDYFTYTDAMLNNSLFSYFLQKNGMKVYKGESTRDVICLDFDFGSRSYEDEKKRLNKMIKNAAIPKEKSLKKLLQRLKETKKNMLLKNAEKFENSSMKKEFQSHILPRKKTEVLKVLRQSATACSIAQAQKQNLGR